MFGESQGKTPESKLPMDARKFVFLGWFFTTVLLLSVITRASSDDDAALPPEESTTNNSTATDDANRNIVLPTEPGDHKLKFRTHIGDRLVEMSYLLHLPPDYNDQTKKHPMLVFFHGVGECGTDLAGVYALGPMTLLKQDGGNPTFAATFPFIVLAPQCPPRGQTWDTDYMIKAVAQLIDQTIKKSRTDPDRVYATGLSMGGLGSWCAAEQSPDLFAAIAPLSAMAWHPENALKQLRYVSVWCVVGLDDQPRFLDGTRSMDAALSKGPIAQRFSYMVGNGHDAWYPPYQNPQFYEWLLAHHRLDAAAKKKLDAGAAPPTTQPLPSAPGHYLLNFAVNIGDQPYHLDYVLYLPSNYKTAAPPSPAMLFLHEQDTIGPDYHGLCVHGPDLALEQKPGLKTNFPFVIISPRLPIKCDWESAGMTQALLALVDHVSQSINIDPDRLSVTGINAGAGGAWKLAVEAPARFSAIVPVMIDGTLAPGDDRAQVVDSMPGRTFIKATQSPSIDRMSALISRSKLDWHLAKLSENATALGELPIYSDHQLLTWLADQRRKTPVSTIGMQKTD
jgi:predicted peptidase